MKKTFILGMTLLALASCSSSKKATSPLDGTEWIDLSYSFDSNTPYWPNNPRGFEHHTDAEGVTPLGYYYSSYSVFAPEHGGTHLDAPIHFAAGGMTLDQLPLANLTGNAILIDISEKALKNRDYLLSVDDVQSWEKNTARFPRTPSFSCAPVMAASIPIAPNISALRKPALMPCPNCIFPA